MGQGRRGVSLRVRDQQAREGPQECGRSLTAQGKHETTESAEAAPRNLHNSHQPKPLT